MLQFKRFLYELWMDDRGQGMVEYGLVMAFVAAIILGALSLLG